MNFVKTAKGNLKYRSPTIIESVGLVKIVVGFISGGDDTGAKLAIMENIHNLLDYSELDGISSFEELNNHSDDMNGPLFQIAGIILDKVVTSFSKKG